MNTTITHPEGAWIVLAVPLWIAVATVLAAALLARWRAHLMIQRILAWRTKQRRRGGCDMALNWDPPITRASTLLASSLGALLIVLTVLSQIAPILAAVICSGPATAMLIWLFLWWQERRYVARLEADLPATVGRLESYLRAGSGFQPALTKVVEQLPAGPLHSEWSFILARLGIRLESGVAATPAAVVGALALQTPSQRQAILLGHLEVALSQPQDALIARVRAAYQALYAADRRRSAAASDMSQMRYSGMAVGLAGLGMALYLMLTQWDRFILAYTGPLAIPVGFVVISALLAPFIGGMLLAQVDDVQY